MHNFLLYLLFLLSFIPQPAESVFEATKDLPVAYQGRFRSLESSSRLWLYDIYHRRQLKTHDLSSFDAQDPSALDLLWRVHFFGYEKWDHAPFFWIHYASVKSLLKLDPLVDHASYRTLYHALYEEEATSLAAIKVLILNEFAQQYHSASNRSFHNKIELKSLSQGLWITLQDNRLVVTRSPKNPPWNYLKPGTILSSNADADLNNLSRIKNTAEELNQIIQQLHPFTQARTKNIQRIYEEFAEDMQRQSITAEEIAKTLHSRFLITQRLHSAGSTLNMLPLKASPGEWVSLHAFHTKNYDQQKKELQLSNNFTTFSDQHFSSLRKAYFELEEAILSHKKAETVATAISNFADHYNVAYAAIADTPYKHAQGKALFYPSFMRLKAETLYANLPLIEITLLAYALALFLMLSANKKIKRLSFFFLITGFLIHTAVLAFRCYILQRPPVSNMFETVVYVPWIAIAIGLTFFLISRSRVVIAAAVFASFALLVLLRLTEVDARLENVQAVLDSQYWLVIHVLMIVASYGAFVVCGILGHFYLINVIRQQPFSVPSQQIAKGILHTMYVGVALLIPGTILGGVWAAESWGRFWDWDPKESWAFISACVYVLFIHAYTFNYIRDFGLAVGSIFGLLAISFTWYGVNYVLGTGLHSYGFGSGGEIFYYLYVAAEILFILYAMRPYQSLDKKT